MFVEVCIFCDGNNEGMSNKMSMRSFCDIAID